MRMWLSDTGGAFDPTMTDNEISPLLAKKAAVEIVYSYDSNQPLCNRVDSQI